MYDLIMSRRSIRKYKNKDIEKDKLSKIIECALLSPSSRGINPWEFIIVKNKDMLEKLSKAKNSGSSFLAAAPLAIIVIADNTKSDVWIEDAAIAAIIIQLEAEKLGIGSCWIQIRNRLTKDGNNSEMVVKNLLQIPDTYSIECIISMGYPDETREQHSFEEMDFGKIHREIY